MCQSRGEVSKLNKFRARNFCLVLYDDDPTHNQAIEKIKRYYEYALILHDKDFEKEDKDKIKKSHYHIVLKFKNAKWNTSLAEELGITPNYIEECRDLKRALLYLIHYNEPEKFQYNCDEIHGPLKKRIEIILDNDDKNENDKVLDLLKWINSFDCTITFNQFVEYSASCYKWDVVRRGGNLWINIINEHNSKYQFE